MRSNIYRYIYALLLTVAVTSVGQAQESYTWNFSENDFELISIGDAIEVTATDKFDVIASQAGAPKLPVMIKKIINPLGYEVNDFDVTFQTTPISSGKVMIGATDFLMCNTNTDSDTNAEPSSVSMPATSEKNPVILIDGANSHHGVGFASFKIMPLLYDADERILSLVTQVTLTVKRSPKNNTSVDCKTVKVRRDLFNTADYLNLPAFETYTGHFTPQGITPGREYIDYVIITADSLREAFKELAEWRNFQGYKTKIVSVDSIYNLPCIYSGEQEKIKSYLYDLYQNHDLKYCMLGGDDSVVPCKYCYVTSSGHRPDDSSVTFEEDIPADSYYASFENNFLWNENGNDITGEEEDNVDFTAEIYLSRLLVRTTQQVKDYTRKLLHYEKNPDRGYLKRILLGGIYRNEEKHQQTGSSEGKDAIERISSIIDSLDMTFEISKLCDDGIPELNMGPFTAPVIKDYIDQGYHLIGFITSGDDRVYRTEPQSEKKYYNYVHAGNQKNQDPSIIVTTAAVTNKFDLENYPCLSEVFLRNPNGGAIAYFGSTSNNWTDTDEPKKNVGECFFHMLSKIHPFEYFDNYNKLAYYTAYIKEYARDLRVSDINNSSNTRANYFGHNIMGDPILPILICGDYELDADYKNNKLNLTYTSLYQNNDNTQDKIVYYRINYAGSTVLGSVNLNSNSTINVLNQQFDASLNLNNGIPLTYKYRKTGIYELNNTIVDENLIIKAPTIKIGENVVVKRGAKLRLIAHESIEVGYNVDCEKDGTLEMIVE